MLYRLHANVYAAPGPAPPGAEAVLRGVALRTLAGEEGGPPLFTAPMPVSFEAMQEALLRLPRSDCEPDGFFLVTGGSGADFWRLNGHMHEYAGAMHRVELNGECPPDTLDSVLQTMGWPAQQLVFELVQEGVSLDEEGFRAWAGGGQGK